MATTRQRRIQELLVHEISDILRREFKDPRLGFVTITDAEVTPDLRHARVFYSVLGDAEAQAASGKVLGRATGFVRTEFARRSQMRFVPEIHFHFDPSVERSARISQLLAEARQQDAGPVGPEIEPEPGGGSDPEGE